MRILVDYRPALRARSGVGEWVHNLSRAILGARDEGSAAARGVDLTLLTASWSDRPRPDALRELRGARFVHRRLPNRLLTWSWNRMDWPPVEALAGMPIDLVHSPNPVGIPSRGAAGAVTVHDLDFLDHPERASGEMRRDYPRLVGRHAVAADLVVAVSRYTAALVRDRLGVAEDRLAVCRAGLPAWIDAQPPALDRRPGQSHILFVGTLEPRKNIPGLLRAYRRLRALGPAPPLVLAGGATDDSRAWMSHLRGDPVSAQVEFRGYVEERDKAGLYAGAALLVLPSFEEGFGLTALEALALGVPVVATSVGAIPEVVGNAALLVPPGDDEALSNAMRRVLSEAGLAADLRSRGLERARGFSWNASACSLLERFREVLDRRRTDRARGRE